MLKMLPRYSILSILNTNVKSIEKSACSTVVLNPKKIKPDCAKKILSIKIDHLNLPTLVDALLRYLKTYVTEYLPLVIVGRFQFTIGYDWEI